MMYSLIKPLLFKLEAEKAHSLALASLRFIPAGCFKKASARPITVFDLQFQHPVGLAAGLDKNAEYLDGLQKLGFSFIEVGTVTPRPQYGNPQPRLFRIPQAEAIINRMGFNNKGIDVLVSNVQQSSYKGILGINIGKNKDTALHKAHEDYLYCLKKAYPYASYITINVSSPNTPELRQLQHVDFFGSLLNALFLQRQRLEQMHQKHVPLLIKVSPDEENNTLKHMADLIMHYKIDGVIASNTTSNKEVLKPIHAQHQHGGLSGRPLRDRSLKCVRILKQLLGNQVIIIGVGGIDSVASAEAQLTAGASLVQVYTGLVYRGPGLVSDIVNGLSEQ